MKGYTSISDNFHLFLKYTPLDAVSICVVKMFYFENIYMLGGF